MELISWLVTWCPGFVHPCNVVPQADHKTKTGFTEERNYFYTPLFLHHITFLINVYFSAKHILCHHFLCAVPFLNEEVF
jgi:hypothetical protein